MVANVVEHPVSRGAVAGIKHLEEGHHGTDGLLPSSAPPALLRIGGGPRAHSSCLPIGLVSLSLLHQTRKNPLKVGMAGTSDVGKRWLRKGETFCVLVIVSVRLLGIRD